MTKGQQALHKTYSYFFRKCFFSDSKQSKTKHSQISHRLEGHENWHSFHFACDTCNSRQIKLQLSQPRTRLRDFHGFNTVACLKYATFQAAESMANFLPCICLHNYFKRDMKCLSIVKKEANLTEKCQNHGLSVKFWVVVKTRNILKKSLKYRIALNRRSSY